MHPLIYDWNGERDGRRTNIALDDETLRDGLQSPSVRTPSIDEKIRILHLIDALGIETADIGLPGAGPHVVADVERLAREIVQSGLHVQANCAARTVVADITPIVEVSQRVGLPIECCAFIGSSPIRQFAEDWDLDLILKRSAEAIDVGVKGGLEIAYVQDPVALFEVQVQGSGRIALAEGGVMNLGFDGSNNRPYTAVGNVLLEMGVFKSKEEATWPAIRDWLKRNPAKGREVMRRNERFIFFKDTRSAAATGSQGVALVAQRSLAVDPTLTPYGTPIWIDTTRPVLRKPGTSEAYRRLMVAQDSGAAIKGPARGDVFFGAGTQAADWAGRMVAGGRAIVLVPNKT